MLQKVACAIGPFDFHITLIGRLKCSAYSIFCRLMMKVVGEMGEVQKRHHTIFPDTLL